MDGTVRNVVNNFPRAPSHQSPPLIPSLRALPLSLLHTLFCWYPQGRGNWTEPTPTSFTEVLDISPCYFQRQYRAKLAGSAWPFLAFVTATKQRRIYKWDWRRGNQIEDTAWRAPKTDGCQSKQQMLNHPWDMDTLRLHVVCSLVIVVAKSACQICNNFCIEWHSRLIYPPCRWQVVLAVKLKWAV